MTVIQLRGRKLKNNHVTQPPGSNTTDYTRMLAYTANILDGCNDVRVAFRMLKCISIPVRVFEHVRLEGASM